MLNFGASKNRVGGEWAPGPPGSAPVFTESHRVIWFSVFSYLGLKTD